MIKIIHLLLLLFSVGHAESDDHLDWGSLNVKSYDSATGALALQEEIDLEGIESADARLLSRILPLIMDFRDLAREQIHHGRVSLDKRQVTELYSHLSEAAYHFDSGRMLGQLVGLT